MILTRRAAIALTAAAGLAPALPARGAAPRTLSNRRASPAARRLYAYLWSQYGRRTLTGQQEQGALPPNHNRELAYLEQITGRLPAILGLDYINPRDNDAVNDRATAWARAGGIVTLCWHWGAPDIGTGYENAKRDFDVAAALRPGTPQQEAMLRDLDATAARLAVLRDRGVPVLWRPFHEFSGDWFWWGKHGPDAFKALWALMYDRYTRLHRLDHLIWVLGWAGQNVDPAYYPGRASVDIAGADIYAKDHGNLAPMFGQVKRIVGETVPICLHENGPVPDPALLGPDADWLWFMTWHTRWLMGDDQNQPDQLRRAFDSARYVTRDELPASIGWRPPRRRDAVAHPAR
ncbi:glycosyl hydrolase [Sphingomonas sp. CV7422]|uniref:glycosyl hydrolase n=1 Tax=Sphingomonas sp. CV7422 TaxID=3018036 RepID=UPI0022FE66DA|nr:glycosyl hydrolase [Sphingomonas sp. CV7422]